MSENKLTRTLIGKAISTKMDKTVTVLVERKVKHLIGKDRRQEQEVPCS